MVACEIKSYRNKILLPIKDGNIGFYRKNSHDIINHDGCVCHGALSQMKLSIILNKYLMIKKVFSGDIYLLDIESTNEVMLGFYCLPR